MQQTLFVSGDKEDVRRESLMNDKSVIFHKGNVLDAYDEWESPTIIMSDGPYGVSGYPGDPSSPDGLGEAYRPHIEKWSQKSKPFTSLWFWNTEIGWANVHPVLAENGWIYNGASIWNKGVGHLAGNINTKTIRRIPAVTEMCVHYVREAWFQVEHDSMSMKQWLRHEWQRSGLPLYKTNEACGVKNAATRKYFTQCELWYFPPTDAFVQFRDYANTHGLVSERPYFSIDGKRSMTAEEWTLMRFKFECEHGITNVWDYPAVRGKERIKSGTKALHSNQKPLDLMKPLIRMTSNENDLVWEPFGGLCSATIASIELNRRANCSEMNEDYFDAAELRISTALGL